MNVRGKLVELFYDNNVRCDQKIEGLADDVMDIIADCVSEAISIIPPADAVPVRHGRWNNGDPYCPVCRKDKFRGLDADIWADWQPDYYPNCGAKMNYETEDNDD